MKKNLLVHGVCSLIGDFLGIAPTLVEFSKSYKVFIDTASSIDGLVDLLHSYDIKRKCDNIVIDEHRHSNMAQAYIKSHSHNWYMTQAFMDDLGFHVPYPPPKVVLSFPKIETKRYDYLLSPFARSLTPEQKWQRERWQSLVDSMPNSSFALLGASQLDDMDYVKGKNVDVVFDFSFPKLCNLFKNCGVLISVVTGTSHLAFHLGTKNIVLTMQNELWGRNPDAFCITKTIHTITLDDVRGFIDLLPPYKSFDEEYYFKQNPDVAEFIRMGGPLKSAHEHFWVYGKAENRKHRWIKD